jgi:hypothetical protein
MARNTLVFHSALSPESISVALLRSIESEVALRSVMPWFIRLVWKGWSRKVCGVVEGNTFRLKKWNAAQWSPNFYGKWEAEYSGTRIEGYFDLAPLVRLSLRFTLVLLLGFAVIGIVLNTLDLKAGTHFTVDPDIGLPISLLFVPFALGIYLVAHMIGSRSEKSLLRFLEQTLAANRVR